MHRCRACGGAHRPLGRALPGLRRRGTAWSRSAVDRARGPAAAAPVGGPGPLRRRGPVRARSRWPPGRPCRAARRGRPGRVGPGPDRPGRARPGPRGRARPGLGHPARRASRAWASRRCCSRSWRSMAAAGAAVLLVSAEESAHQVRRRAERLGPLPAGLLVLASHRSVRPARRRAPTPSPSWSWSTRSRPCPTPPSAGVPGQRAARSGRAPTWSCTWPSPARAVRAGRPRHQGRDPGRSPDARSTWSTRCSASRATATTPCARCGPPSTGSAPPASSGSSR